MMASSNLTGFMFWGQTSDACDNVAGQHRPALHASITSQSFESVGTAHTQGLHSESADTSTHTQKKYQKKRPEKMGLSRQVSYALSSSPTSPLISSRLPPASPPNLNPDDGAPSPIPHAIEADENIHIVNVAGDAQAKTAVSRQSTSLSIGKKTSLFKVGEDGQGEITAAEGTQESIDDSRFEASAHREKSQDSFFSKDQLYPLSPLLYACGSNARGQSGQQADGNADKEPIPRDVISMLMFENKGEVIEDNTECSPDFLRVPLAGHRIMHVAAHGPNSAALTDKGVIYVWGDNARGQLGRRLEAVEFSNTPLKTPSLRPGRGFIATRQNKRGAPREAAAVACGLEFCAALSTDGMAFAWGDNMYGQLGVQHSKGSWVRFVSEPTHIGPFAAEDRQRDAADHDEESCKQKCTAVACGQDFTAVLVNQTFSDGDKEDGVLFMFGRNDRGQCGQGILSMSARPARVLIPEGRKVTLMACGGMHSLAVCVDGSVYAWGSNSCGQLGLGFVCAWREEPQEVTALERAGVLHVSCGLFHSAAATDGGLVFTWGDGARGQLGHGESVSYSLEPRVVSALTQCCVCTASCGDFHTAAATVDGKLYAWGLEDRGRIGVGSFSSGRGGASRGVQWLPVRILGSCASSASKGEDMRQGTQDCGAYKAAYADMWCCSVACGEEHTLILAHDGHDKQQQLATRAATLSGLCMGTRALRAMVNSYELPARLAAEWSRPIMSYYVMRDALSHSDAALGHARALLWDLALSWSGGGSESELSGVLLAHADGTRTLLEYLLKLPVRMARVRSELKVLKFSRFVLEKEREVRAQGAWALLEHPWVRVHQHGQQINTQPEPRSLRRNASLRRNDSAVSVASRMLAAQQDQHESTSLRDAHMSQRGSGIPAGDGEQQSGGIMQHTSSLQGGIETRDHHDFHDSEDDETALGVDAHLTIARKDLSDLTRLMAACAALAPFLTTCIRTLLHEQEVVLSPANTKANTGTATDDEMKIVVEQGAASILGLNKALATVIRDMNHAAVRLSKKQDRWWRSGRVLAVRNATYRVWIACVCLLGFDAYGDWGLFALVLMLVWVLGAPFALVFTAMNFATNEFPAFYLRWGIGGAIGVYLTSVIVLVYLRVREIHKHANIRRRQRRRRIRDTISNRVALLGLLAEAWQLSAVSFGEGSPFDNKGFVYPYTTPYTPVQTYTGLNTILPPSLLDFRLLLPHYDDMTVGVCIMVIVPVIWSFSRALPVSVLRRGSPMYALLAHQFVPFMASVLFMPVVARIASSVSCAYAPPSASFYMESSVHRIVPIAEAYIRSTNITSCYDLYYTFPTSKPLQAPFYARSRVNVEALSSLDIIESNSTQYVSLCGSMSCWETRFGEGGVMPHAYYALLGLLAFAVFFPSAALFLVREFACVRVRMHEYV
jgi:alpha-tubulin suppressor-like RCC1 family protein